MKNRVGVTTDDIQLRSLDQDGTGGTVFYDPAYKPVIEEPIELDQNGTGGTVFYDPAYKPVIEEPIETAIIYPNVIDTLATQVIEPTATAQADYIPEECIDCETQPELVPNPYAADTGVSSDTTATPTANKFSDWIKANPMIAIAGGAGLFLLFDKKKKKVGVTNKNKRLLLAGGAAVAIYFLLKKKQAAQIPDVPIIDTVIDQPVILPEQEELPQTVQTDPYAYSELDRSYYDQMWRLLSNNYLYQEHPYDYPWAGEVLKEYKYIVDGHPTSSQWNVGVPGAFMVMLDRWYRYYLTDSKKQIFQPVLFQIGDLYKAYLNQINTL